MRTITEGVLARLLPALPVASFWLQNTKAAIEMAARPPHPPGLRIGGPWLGSVRPWEPPRIY